MATIQVLEEFEVSYLGADVAISSVIETPTGLEELSVVHKLKPDFLCRDF
jgi:hypothetical protein